MAFVYGRVQTRDIRIAQTSRVTILPLDQSTVDKKLFGESGKAKGKWDASFSSYKALVMWTIADEKRRIICGSI